MRLLLFGNSGSGKSTLATSLAGRHGVPLLDLDSIVWEPGKIAVQRPDADVAASLQAFIDAHANWIIEGCYGDLVERVAANCTLLVFLNPGLEACLANNRRRPWEPHKYASPELQDGMLEPLQAWVADYYQRNDAWSHAFHRRVFDAHSGPKVELATISDYAEMNYFKLSSEPSVIASNDETRR